MSRTQCSCLMARHCFPRVSGDEPLTEDLVLDTLQFSPRERG